MLDGKLAAVYRLATAIAGDGSENVEEPYIQDFAFGKTIVVHSIRPSTNWPTRSAILLFYVCSFDQNSRQVVVRSTQEFSYHSL